MLSPCLFNLYTEYIKWNAGLDEAQGGIMIARRNISNLIYADDTTLMEESKEELKESLDESERGEKKAGSKLNIQKTKFMASCPITSWGSPITSLDGETMKMVTDFILLGSKITADGDCSHEIKRYLLLGRKAMTKLDSIKKQRHYFANKVSPSQRYGFSSSHVWMWELDHKKPEHGRIDALNCGVGEGNPTSPS